MIELVIVSRLLEYPDAALWQHQQEMFEAIAASKNLPKEDAHALGIFLRDLTTMDPLDARAQYSELFDRGRATSLLLFEHVHGESRDRGRDGGPAGAVRAARLAVKQPRIAGPSAAVSGVLAQLPQSEAVEGLKDIAPILALLSARLQQRESRYAVLFDLLLKLANTAIDSDKVAEKLPTKRAMIRRRRWMLSGKKSRLNSLLTKAAVIQQSLRISVALPVPSRRNI